MEEDSLLSEANTNNNIENEEFETEYKRSEKSLIDSGLKSRQNHSILNIIDQDSSLIHLQSDYIDETHDQSVFLEKEVCHIQDPNIIFEGKPFVIFSRNNKIQNSNKVAVDIIKIESIDTIHESACKIKSQVNQLTNLKKDKKAFINDSTHSNDKQISNSDKNLWNINKKYVEVTSALEKLYSNKMATKNLKSTFPKLISDIKIKNADITVKSDESSFDSDYQSNQSTQQADIKSIYYNN